METELKIDKSKLVNGKYYPIWQEIIDQKEKWIGGQFISKHRDAKAVMLVESPPREIVDIVLQPNGKDSALFLIMGKTADGEESHRGVDVRYLCRQPHPDMSWDITFVDWRGDTFSIRANSLKCAYCGKLVIDHTDLYCRSCGELAYTRCKVTKQPCGDHPEKLICTQCWKERSDHFKF